MNLSNFQLDALQKLKDTFGEKWFTCSDCLYLFEHTGLTLMELHDNQAIRRRLNPNVEEGWDGWLYQIKSAPEKISVTFEDGNVLTMFKDELVPYMETHKDAIVKKIEPHYE